ncbi:MAG: acyl-CoA dehydrogenase family protein [Acidimicrobiales bacterium]
MTSATDSPFRPEAFAEVCAAAGSRGAEIEQLRRLPRDLVDDLIGTGVFRLWVPRAYGGAQADIQALLDAIEQAAYHDGSTGWCVMIGGTTALNAGYLPAEHAQEIYGDPRAVTGGFGRPVGRAVAVDGGLRVSGHWSWGSGTSHCTWIGGGTRVVDEAGDPARLADGTVAPFVYFPAGEVELDDNWHVMGLKGTASVDYRVADAFVPEGRWAGMGAGPAVVDDPLYRFSLLGALGLGVATVTLGLARRAIDELAELGTKVPDASSRSLAERAPVQADLARADASVRSARAWMAEVVGAAWDAAADGKIGDEEKRRIRAAANHAAAASAEAVDRCYTLGGGTAVFADSPLQRIFRDVHVATQHAMIAPRMWEPLGRMLLGLPTSTAQF